MTVAILSDTTLFSVDNSNQNHSGKLHVIPIGRKGQTAPKYPFFAVSFFQQQQQQLLPTTTTLPEGSL